MNINNVLAILWAFLVSLTWLIPNHYRPWANFHSDAWIGFVGALTFIPLLVSKEKIITWPLFASITFGLGFVPWIHYLSGLLSFAGQAWITSAYLFAFSMAIVVGANLEKRATGALSNSLLGAIVFASIASVGLALGSWTEVLETGLNNYLSMGYSGDRHYANIGQPNMLASLLLWGVIGCLWGYSKKIIGLRVAIFAGMFIMLGIVLTKSRTAYVAGVFTLLSLLIYGRTKKFNKIRVFCAGLLFAYFAGVYFFQWMDINIFQRGQEGIYVRGALNGDLRLNAWRLFIDAVGDRPWFGYGWTEVANAQIAVADRHASLGGMFGHTHNAILDLYVWLGIPVASLVITCLMSWLWLVARRINNLDDLLLLLLLAVIGIHSMLEYPLQYASFLIPVGFVVGTINERMAIKYSGKVRKIFVAGISLILFMLFIGFVNDYAKVEQSYGKWRFDRAALAYPIPDVPNIPELIFLNQFEYWFEMIRIRPHTQMTTDELALREKVVLTYPSPGSMYELALAYALNGQPEKTQYWLVRICKLTNSAECATLKNAWSVQQNTNSSLEHTIWPQD